MKSKITIGILANVDAGKTTLTESILYTCGKLQTLGRVDNQDAFLDTEKLEKQRGITIYSKPARLSLDQVAFTLLDTPGHVDFSMEMERALSVLDYAILLISAPDGVEGHTLTLWKLLNAYKVPTLIFVNKMDQGDYDSAAIMDQLKKHIGGSPVDFSRGPHNDFYEEIAMRKESALEAYLDEGVVSLKHIQNLIASRDLVPVYFGSALKLEGIHTLLEGIRQLLRPKVYGPKFGARVYKISRDSQGVRLVHLKITGGQLGLKDSLQMGEVMEKVNQIRIYDGSKYESVSQVVAGDICTLVGIQSLKAGDGLGLESEQTQVRLEPVLSYKILFNQELSPREVLPKLQEIEDEHPELSIQWEEALQEIHVKVMGEVQIEILKEIVSRRYGFEIDFGLGNIVYKETIGNMVEGVGHFEPLRHYAEVHLILKPNERGRGLTFDSDCDEANLAKNWQNLILTHLGEKRHRGVLIGAPITDIHISVVSGRAHNRHTEGGDFREATYRAVRQGLMEAESILLEPYYTFKLTLPQSNVGKAMIDIGNMGGKCEVDQHLGDQTILVGEAPVRTMRHYHSEVMAYTKGYGHLVLTLKGYDLCQNSDEVVAERAYDPEMDYRHPVGSVFCQGGAGYYVPWDQVKDLMHADPVLKTSAKAGQAPLPLSGRTYNTNLSLEEIDQILTQATFKNQGKKTAWKRSKKSSDDYKQTYAESAKPYKSKANLEKFLLVDGYNIIFAWEALKSLADDDQMEAAKSKLLDIMSNYAGLKQIRLMVVFDAYKVKGHVEEVLDYHNIQVVYTREAQTADQFIEKFAYDHHAKYAVVVATSDGLQQMIVRGAGSDLLSARELLIEVQAAAEAFYDRQKASQTKEIYRFEDAFKKAEEM